MAREKRIIGVKTSIVKSCFLYFIIRDLFKPHENSKPIRKAIENRIVQLRDAQPNVNVIIKAEIVTIFHLVGNWEKNNARKQKGVKKFPHASEYRKGDKQSNIIHAFLNHIFNTRYNCRGLIKAYIHKGIK